MQVNNPHQSTGNIDVYVRVNQFMEKVDAINSDPGQRNDIQTWQSLLKTELLDNDEIREILLYRTFYYFVEQFSNVSGAALDLPHEVTRLFAEYFGWINAEAQLTSRFGKQQINLIFQHAYREPAAAGIVFAKSAFRPVRNFSLYRRLLIILLVCSLVIFYVLTRYALDADRRSTPYYDCKVLFTDRASQQDYTACAATAEKDDKARLLFALALLYSTKFQQEPAAALNWVKQDAEHANPRAMYILGALQGEELKTGKVAVKQDFAAAMYWLEQAAKAGELHAYTHLASLYVIRNSDDEDMHAARQLLLTAAAAEQADAYLGMALFELLGVASSKNYDLARNWLDLYARAVIPTGSNEAAWLLSTSPNTDFRAPGQAMKYIDLLNVDESDPARVMYLDTIAAVYAANGDFQQAVTYQTQAITGLKKQEPDIYQDSIKGFQERLDYYQNNKIWIEVLPEDYLQKRFADLKNEIYNRQLRAIINATQ
ncbi:MAG: hypothetical protein HW386_514 [Gammaproteobacteria bacterium]|nr:hypothetical protein [Gammaproteobacteria bacterium]